MGWGDQEKRRREEGQEASRELLVSTGLEKVSHGLNLFCSCHFTFTDTIIQVPIV